MDLNTWQALQAFLKKKGELEECPWLSVDNIFIPFERMAVIYEQSEWLAQ